MKTLAGDRGIEWGFVKNHLPPATSKWWSLLDFGPMDGFYLSMDALQKGWEVVAIGLEAIQPPDSRIRYMVGDVSSFNLYPPFSVVLNCSTVEHVGLGRYDDPIGENFDLQAMACLRRWMKPESLHILTIPIGQDAVVGHWHRVYGKERLPRLLEGYKILEEQYHIKTDDDSAWVPCPKERALSEVPGLIPKPSILNLSYALGGFVLCLA